ncbi:monovalent cation/H+ antiporter subunit E [Natronomonas marina]|uniref:monovalent cation/H+ antiporter subunit E n=1 Tax=Natronomonas marina TaxID=2961939 RepID=UPI0020C94848|nr:monovalent cation/H+ antiporter subunit E [Natronomonas marina]
MPEDPPDRRDDAGPLLVPVGESVTLRQTVAYAVREALAGAGEIHFVAPVAWHDIGDVGADVREETEALLERVAVWADEDADDALDVETAIVGADEYLFGPDDYARVLAAYADDHGIDRVVVDPEYSPGGNVPILQPMEASLEEAGLTVEEAPVGRATRRERLLRRGGALQFVTLFGISYLFYHLLSGFTLTNFDLVTGVATATLVATMLHRITFSDRVRLPSLARQLLRLGIYTPYLLYEIVKSNLLVSYAILHPELPIEPRMTEVECALWGAMPVTTLANSITLTPGTLTVRVRGRGMKIHTLLPAAREGLFDGALERGVRFVFYGRRALAIATPRERGDCRILDEEGDGE